jgi:hypothetical protein
VIAIDNAGTVELAIVNSLIYGAFDEGFLISTTAEGGVGGADSGSVFYSASARTSVAFRVIGYVYSTQATAGSWASSPSNVSGNAETIVPTLGVSQTWQDVMSSRAAGTTYTNSTGRAIMVAVTPYQANAGQSRLSVDSVVVARQFGSIGGGPNINLETQLVAIVPAGSTYIFEVLSGSVSVVVWAELR